MVKILTGEFVTSVAAGGALPADTRAVIALVGRSNVGKSTLVNTLARRRIARAGAKPGTTRLLNVYRLRVSLPGRQTLGLSLVDLPGYGYARGPRETAQDFETLTTRFFDAMVDSPAPQAAGRAGRARLAGAVLVVDVRHPGLEADRAARDWLAGRGCPVVIVATKGDRLSRAARQRALGAHEAALDSPVIPAPRGADGAGFSPLWRTLADLAVRGEPPRRTASGEAP